jgi:hypothetical protein
VATTTKRKAPTPVRLPSDVLAEVEADARKRGVNRNDWIVEACRRRLHPPESRSRGGTCEHPRPGWLSQAGGRVICRVCGDPVPPKRVEAGE